MVASVFNYYWKTQPIEVERGGGISGLGLEMTELHLEGIYIPNKTVFYAVHTGQHDLAGEQFWHDTTGAHLNEKGKMQAEALRSLFRGKALGRAFHDATRPAKETASTLRGGLPSETVDALKPIDGKKETPEEFRKRVRGGIRAIAQLGTKDQPPVIVAHTAVLREVLAMFGAIEFEDPAVIPGTVIEVKYDQKRNCLVARAATVELLRRARG